MQDRDPVGQTEAGRHTVEASSSEGLPDIYKAMIRGNGWRLGFTYILLFAELGSEMLRPWLWGSAIDFLLRGEWHGIYIAVVQHMFSVAVGTLRRRFDTRTFAGIYGRFAADVVLRQRSRNTALSQISARARLSSELIEFAERDVQTIVNGFCHLFGSIVAMWFIDPLVALAGAALIVPIALLNVYYAKLALRFNGRLNNRIEAEVSALAHDGEIRVRRHYFALTRWRIKLSDAGACHFLRSETFVLPLVVFSLWRFTQAPGADAGSIFAGLSYVWMLIDALDTVPRCVEQLSKIRDVARRLN